MRPEPVVASENASRPLERVVQVSRRQISCQLANESVILHLEEGMYYGLNAVASRVWELIQLPRTVREIREILLSEYDIEEAVCTRDLLELLDRLKERKLIDLSDGVSAHDS